MTNSTLETYINGPGPLGRATLTAFGRSAPRRFLLHQATFRWGGALRSALCEPIAKRDFDSWISRGTAQPIAPELARALLDGPLEQEQAGEHSAAALASLRATLEVFEPALPSLPAASDLGLHPNAIRLALGAAPFPPRLVLSLGDIRSMGIELPGSGRRWAAEQSARLDRPELRDRIVAILGCAAFMATHRRGRPPESFGSWENAAAQCLAWADSATGSLTEHPFAIALLELTAALRPEQASFPIAYSQARSRLAHAGCALEVGALLRLELAAHLSAALDLLFENELLSELRPPEALLQRLIDRSAREILARGWSTAEALVAVSPQIETTAHGEVAERVRETLATATAELKAKVEDEPAWRWAKEDAERAVPRAWLTHGIIGQLP